jgi:hypothetical protein
MYQENCTSSVKVSYEERNSKTVNRIDVQIRNVHSTIYDKSSSKFFVLKPSLVSCLRCCSRYAILVN